MRINFDQNLLKLDGTPIMQPNPNKEDKVNPMVPLTLKEVCVNALLQFQSGGPVIEGKEKLERWQNAKVINKGGILSFTKTYITKLKELVNQAYPSPTVVGQAWIMLESGKEEPEEEEKKKEN